MVIKNQMNITGGLIIQRQMKKDKKEQTVIDFSVKSFEDLKFNNGSHTHVYFKDKQDYLKASQRYLGLQTSRAEPIVDNLAEIYDKSEKKNNHQTLFIL